MGVECICITDSFIISVNCGSCTIHSFKRPLDLCQHRCIIDYLFISQCLSGDPLYWMGHHWTKPYPGNRYRIGMYVGNYLVNRQGKCLHDRQHFLLWPETRGNMNDQIQVQEYLCLPLNPTDKTLL